MSALQQPIAERYEVQKTRSLWLQGTGERQSLSNIPWVSFHLASAKTSIRLSYVWFLSQDMMNHMTSKQEYFSCHSLVKASSEQIYPWWNDQGKNAWLWICRTSWSHSYLLKYINWFVVFWSILYHQAANQGLVRTQIFPAWWFHLKIMKFYVQFRTPYDV